MELRFAPVNVPLQRRIQTVAVLQWIFSFLLLGNSLPPPALPQKEGERRGFSFFFPNRRHPRASGCFVLCFHGGTERCRGCPWLLGSGSSLRGELWMPFLLWVSFFPWNPLKIRS